MPATAIRPVEGLTPGDAGTGCAAGGDTGVS
jgi:hypothetical protein